MQNQSTSVKLKLFNLNEMKQDFHLEKKKCINVNQTEMNSSRHFCLCLYVFFVFFFSV